MSMLSDHKQIEKRNMKEQFRQTQAVLCAVLKKVGPVVLTDADFLESGGVGARKVDDGIEWRSVNAS
jgi:hypothetical protein